MKKADVWRVGPTNRSDDMAIVTDFPDSEDGPMARAWDAIRASVTAPVVRDEDLERLFAGRMADLSSTAAVMEAQASRYWHELDPGTRLMLVSKLRAVERTLDLYRRALCQDVASCR